MEQIGSSDTRDSVPTPVGNLPNAISTHGILDTHAFHPRPHRTLAQGNIEWACPSTMTAGPREPLVRDLADIELRVLEVLERIPGDCHASVSA